MRKLFFILVLALMAPVLNFGQYINKIYDFDTTSDIGLNIKMKSNGTLLISGNAGNPNSYWGQFATMVLSADGSQVLSKKIYGYADHGIYQNGNGGMITLPNDFFITTPTVVYRANGQNLRASAALIKIDQWGDTVLLKLYTDTAIAHEYTMGMCRARNGDYLIAGTTNIQDPNAYYQGMLLRIDSNGNLKWKQTYRKSITKYAEIRSVEELPDGRLLIGATSKTYKAAGQLTYYNAAPWLMITDSTGVIVKERILSAKYGMGSAPYVHTDKNGGYYLYGAMDSLVRANDPLDFRNFPSYMASIDTEFNIRWIRPFADTIGRINISNIIQLSTKEYLLFGSTGVRGIVNDGGWIAKLSNTGGLIWGKSYYRDTVYTQTFADAIELPNKNIILSGSSKDHTLPAWRQYDVWILGIDSNGCERPGCAMATEVPTLNPLVAGFNFYPNPSTGAIAIDANEAGVFSINSLEGRVVGYFQIAAGRSFITLPSVASGIYICRFATLKEGAVTVKRLVYAP